MSTVPTDSPALQRVSGAEMRQLYSVVILSGGKSSRMGVDKRTMLWRGRSLLQRIIDGCPACDDLLLSVRDTETAVPAGTRSVVDRFPGAGPLAGVHAALSEMKHDVLFVTTCDAPLVDCRTAEALLPLLGEHDAVVPVSEDGYIHPLAALYRRRVIDTAQERLLRGDRKMRAFAAALDTVYIDGRLLPYGDLTLANLNRPSDLDRLERDLERLT